MFSDLTNSDSIKELGLSNTKAYPSVNSPNDGGFNSEENLRQFIKSIATKPFIIGDTESEISKAFGTSPSSFGIYFNSAKFSVDGYVFKLAPQEDISFDKDSTGEWSGSFNTTYIQKFVMDMCGYGKPDSISLASKLDDFCLSDYNPALASDWSVLQQSWASAVDKDTVIGYVRIAYTESYLESLTIDTGTEEIKFGDNIVDLVEYDSSLEQGGKVDPDNIASYIESQSLDETKPFGCIVSQESDTPTQVNIYYPVFVKTICNKKYIVFKDIYDINYKHDQFAMGYTKNYPSTKCVFVDMDSNAPLDGLYPQGTEKDCQFLTLPTKLYRYQDMYNLNHTQRNTTGQSDISTDVDFDLERFFTKFTFSQIKDIQGTKKVPSVKNTLSYYCLNIPHELHRQENGTDVPIVFMTSEGSLCPNGFIYTSYAGAFEKNYPLEGYVHFVKRIVGANLTPTKQPEDVTFEEIKYYIENGGSDNVYKKYISPAISVYLSLCYCSLMQYCVTPELNVYTDYKNMQSLSCGDKLSAKAASNPNVTTDDFATHYNFSYTDYTYSGTGTNYTEGTDKYNIRYNKDRTSDNWKIHNAVIFESGKNIIGDDIKYTSSPLTSFDSDANNYLLFDDPANYIKRCSHNNSGDNTIPFTLTPIIASGGSCTLDSDPFDTFNIEIDDYLMPRFVGESSYTDTNLLGDLATLMAVSYSGTSNQCASLINSLNYRIRYNTWISCFDYVASVSKDSQGYLCGRNIDNPTIYDGLDFCAKLSKDVTNEDLYLFDLGISCSGTVVAQNNESCCQVVDSTSGNIPTRREAFIHTSKIYGDNYANFDECVESVVTDTLTELDIIDIRDDVNSLSSEVSSITDTQLPAITGDISNMQSSLGTCQKLLYTNSTEYNTYFVYGLDDTDTNKICIVRKGSTSSSGTGNVFTDSTIADVIVTPGVERIEGAIGYNSINIPGSVTNITIAGDTTGDYSSDKLKGPKYIKMEEGLAGTITDPVVRGSVVEAIVPSTFNTNDETFNECGNLTKLTINCSMIDTGFCDTCSSLTTVILSSGFQMINTKAFYNCTSLTTLTYNGTVDGWGNVTKGVDWAITSALGETETRITRVNCINGYWEFSGGSWHDYTNS